VVTAEDARELQRRNPQVPQLTVPDAGHMVPWDNLPGFLNAIDEHVTQPARSQ
jgi:N-formylmaleamate deformylase